MYTHVHGRCMYCCCAVCVCMYVRSLSLGNPVLMLCSSSIPFTVSSLILHSFHCVFSHLPFLSMCLLSSSIPFNVSSLVLHSFHCVFSHHPFLSLCLLSSSIPFNVSSLILHFFHCVFYHHPFLSMCLLSSSIPFTVSSLIIHSFHCVFSHPPTLHCVFSHPPFLSMCLLSSSNPSLYLLSSSIPSLCLLSSSIPFTVSSLVLHSFHCVFYPPPTLHCVFSHPPFFSMCLLPCYVYATRLCYTCRASREGVGADHHSLSFRSHGGRNHLEDNKGRGGRHCLCCGVLPQKGEVGIGTEGGCGL